MEKEFKEYLLSNKISIYIYYEDNVPIAFAQYGLRYDYVEGAKTSPVAYLEGIFVKEEFRTRGIAKELMKKCEKWGKENGCKEIASDCELDNNISFKFHIKSGFKEVNRIICFTKQL